VALREEIDQASMFEEMVGTSAALQRVLSLVSKVAPTDDSVLATGDPGQARSLSRELFTGVLIALRALL
jgi:DNA-binding NtrC family response regulator